MKKVKLPDTIDVSYHTLKITLLDPTVALEVGDQQGSYDVRGQNIFLDSAIIEDSGARAVSLVLHETYHACWYIFNLDKAEEERAVDSFANFTTELLIRNVQLRNWINQELARLVFDIETDGLFDDVSKVHCIVLKDLDTKEVITKIKSNATSG